MDDKALEESIEEIADLIVGSKRIVVFTGAGISTESGIPGLQRSRWPVDEGRSQRFHLPEVRR